ncbi:succinate dehydrogenase/fumarate reductase iron-sulfur subunit [Synechococcus sp. Cruz-9H2]|uniref:succinate dehydrogenase/fumarate reductase iron-sulfur subunit n=1 Tax=unclassified Synechococcus TaxID=2626047 RepID=UPI0020CE8135|nr:MULTISPECIES: succinate dehydrogenase/fumarate reductase iron-sulfur subunit [unclassified Synechococcus]MCP9818259.1 succinate dehydrogenase/fumarate reductase iron-sulfur subunit [Synechococcus sp. Cruz-9H2]MCP9842241.1 succinate dehydrogenase/fumarate reductase iron-sulfur subunit [Synechococcus sp. Edmonson 11F2]MCP9854655.1 succinate dehydrogenase/fumarate reductase iron-sulfur subunit [Synechococcus sp. Cruz-9C9]MCP9861649.1 succinate dehydrogenase/fumarate reductase iron-sulfur subuni
MSGPSSLSLTLRIWRQRQDEPRGRFVDHLLTDLSPALSLLEALDRLNQQLLLAGERPVYFDHDCREGICGSCGFMINGQAQGPRSGTTVCQLYLRDFSDGQVLTLEPWRARAFPLIQDLAVDRSSLDRLLMAGGYVSVNIGSAPEANVLPVGLDLASQAFDAASCIGCGACVAACPNASASLFVAAKLAHLELLPQGQPEAPRRSRRMRQQMEAEGFGACGNQLECSAVCPKEIPSSLISRMNRKTSD